MGEHTEISWCDHTFNPWIGCTKVAPACDGCYAEALMDKRHHRVEWGAPGKGAGTRSRTSEANWREPLKWNRKAAESGTRPFVFCASLADVFDNQAPPEWRENLFDLIADTPHLVWLLLTKRPQNIVDMVRRDGALAGNGTHYLPGNVALGTTIEDQEHADRNVPHLLRAKAELGALFAFVSCEPLLGPINLRQWLFDWGCNCGFGGDDTKDHCPNCGWIGYAAEEFAPCPDCGEELTDYYACPECTATNEEGFGPNSVWLDWIITGHETDQLDFKARPTHPGWTRALRDQAAAAGVPYHHKQNGEWARQSLVGQMDGCFIGDRWSNEVPWNPGGHPEIVVGMERIGKKRAGRHLDGVLHDARPDAER